MITYYIIATGITFTFLHFMDATPGNRGKVFRFLYAAFALFAAFFVVRMMGASAMDYVADAWGNLMDQIKEAV